MISGNTADAGRACRKRFIRLTCPPLFDFYSSSPLVVSSCSLSSRLPAPTVHAICPIDNAADTAATIPAASTVSGAVAALSTAAAATAMSSTQLPLLPCLPLPPHRTLPFRMRLFLHHQLHSSPPTPESGLPPPLACPMRPPISTDNSPGSRSSPQLNTGPPPPPAAPRRSLPGFHSGHLFVSNTRLGPVPCYTLCHSCTGSAHRTPFPPFVSAFAPFAPFTPDSTASSTFPPDPANRRHRPH